MLTITTPAMQRLTRRLARRELAEGVALRLGRRDGGWALRLDYEAVGDTAFTSEGRTVLLLDEPSSKMLNDMTLDTRVRGARTRLRLLRSTGQEV